MEHGIEKCAMLIMKSGKKKKYTGSCSLTKAKLNHLMYLYNKTNLMYLYNRKTKKKQKNKLETHKDNENILPRYRNGIWH